MRSRGLVVAFLCMAGLVLVGGYALVRAASSALRGSSPAPPVQVSIRLWARPESVHVVETISGDQLSGFDPHLVSSDVGYVKNATERTTRATLAYTGRTTTVAADGRSATVTYDVQGRVVYATPLSGDVKVVRLAVEVVSGSLASCLAQYGTNNGTPQLSPCHPGGPAPLTLTRRDNSLERVRLALSR